MPALVSCTVGGVVFPGSPLAGQDPAQVRAGLEGDSGPELLLDAMLKLGPYGLSLAKLRDQGRIVDHLGVPYVAFPTWTPVDLEHR